MRTWSSVRAPWVRRLVTGEPTLLFYRSCPLDQAMRRARVTHDELVAAARNAGFTSMEAVGAVVLETDGTISVVPQDGMHREGILDGIENPENPENPESPGRTGDVQ